MKRINIKFCMVLLTIIILVVTGFTKNAYADWENHENYWKYISDHGYAKDWQQINGRWYYFVPETSVMKIGWFYDEQYNKWYYLNYNGAMDSSKTTSDYPTELNNIGDKIKQHVNEDVVYEGTNQVDDNVFVCFESKNQVAARQYYYQPSTGNAYEIKNGILTNLSTNETIDIFSQEQAIQVVHDYLSDNYKYIPKMIKVEVDDGDSYFIHCYDNEGNDVNSSWYHVNKTTRKVTAA